MKEYKLKINGNDYVVNINNEEDTIAEVEVNGTPFKVEIDMPARKTTPVVRPVAKPSTVATTVAKPTSSVAPPAVNTGEIAINSPLPGVILDVCVKEGDAVKRGQKLIVLEAMKMENVIEASADAKVLSIKVGKGDSVLEGATLVTIG